jgi:hypothetical protein
VTFVTGRRYVYDDVPPNVFAAFSAAFSKGAFFNHEIRDRSGYREVRREHASQPMAQAVKESDAVAPDEIAWASREIICSMKL